MIYKNYRKYAPWLLLGALYIASLITLWPGIVSPDAAVQYQCAISGIYNDHHPPAMSLLWRYLDMIYKGPGLMFSFHLTLLYASAAIFLYMFRDSKFKWWYAIYPALPNMLAYTSLIVKDTGFAYTYLLAGAILSYLMINRITKYKYLLLSIVLLLLFYGTAVKFQAKFLLFVFTIGIAYCLFNYQFNKKSILTGLLIYAGVFISIISFDHMLVPNVQKSHSWQLVKLYDLAAMSLELNEPIFPEFIKNNPNYDFVRVAQEFNPSDVGTLVYPKDSVLKLGSNDIERDILWNTWFETVKQYPLIYLKCRLNLWSYNLTTSPSDRSNPVQFLKDTSLAAIFVQPWISSLIESAFNVFKIALRFVWLFPLLLLYCYYGMAYFKRSTYAAPILMLSLTSLMLLAILFFFSLYATARYVFLCTCFVHASHGFAYRLLRQKSIPIQQKSVVTQQEIGSSERDFA